MSLKEYLAGYFGIDRSTCSKISIDLKAGSSARENRSRAISVGAFGRFRRLLPIVEL